MDTKNEADGTQKLDDWFIEKLGCPKCEQRHPLHLNDSKDSLICACGRFGFPIGLGGIPNLLVENAVLLDDKAVPENVHIGAKMTGGSTQ